LPEIARRLRLGLGTVHPAYQAANLPAQRRTPQKYRDNIGQELTGPGGTPPGPMQVRVVIVPTPGRRRCEANRCGTGAGPRGACLGAGASASTNANPKRAGRAAAAAHDSGRVAVRELTLCYPELDVSRSRYRHR
jgi:hypothetical protein